MAVSGLVVVADIAGHLAKAVPGKPPDPLAFGRVFRATTRQSVPAAASFAAAPDTLSGL
jgi:hypothetical protein